MQVRKCISIAQLMPGLQYGEIAILGAVLATMPSGSRFVHCRRRASNIQTTQSTKTFQPTIGCTPGDGPRGQVPNNYCDRLSGADSKCGKPVADMICKVKGFASSTAHKKGQLRKMDHIVSACFIGLKQAGKGVSQIFDSVTCVQ